MINEEKRAIFKLREIIDYDKKHRLETIYDKEQTEFRNNIELVLDLIEKLQKENEELREITNGYNSLKKDFETFGGIPLIIADEKYFNEGIFTTNFIPKDKIREKIKELEEYIVKIEEETCGRCITIGEDMTIRYLKNY